MALAAGVELKVISERLGHSALRITVDLYIHVVPTVGRAAADRIGEAFAPAARKTDGGVPSAIPARKARKRPERRGDDVSPQVDDGAPEGIRTPNLLIRSQMLYPLSYGRRTRVSARLLVQRMSVPGPRGAAEFNDRGAMPW